MKMALRYFSLYMSFSISSTVLYRAVKIINLYDTASAKSTLTRVCNLHSSSVDGIFHK